ncbi:MAG: PAS-domain containing protein [Alphaproteobacteria bacterium]
MIAFAAGLGIGAAAAAVYFRRRGAGAQAAALSVTQPEPVETPLPPNPDTEPADDDSVLAILDSLPLPVWLRGGDGLGVLYCNSACRNILLDTPEDGLMNRMDGHNPPDHALFSHAAMAQRACDTGREQTASQTLTISGKRRLFDITERPVAFADGRTDNRYTIGVAVDQSVLVSLQDELSAHIAANDAVLDLVTAAVAIFGPDRRLRFYNAAFGRIWRLDVAELDREPSLNAVLDLLRDKRQLPEMVDFPAFKKSWNARFTNLIEPVEDLWFLPDERVVRLVASPHPRGGLIFSFEDVTDKLTLERSFNTATAVQRATLNNLLEAVAVFGSNGRLKLYNRIYRELWGLDESVLAAHPHVSELVGRIQDLKPDGGTGDTFGADLLKKVTEPSPENGRMTVGDGRVLDYAFVPLPDGDCLSVYVDVTDAAKVQDALMERNQALERADLVKSRFVASMSYEFRTPLNAVIGFGELLRSEAFGPLNKRQIGYIDNQLSAAMTLAELINDTLDLAAVQAGTISAVLAPLEITALIKDVGRRVRERKPDGAQIVTTHDGPVRIAGDTERLRRAFGYIIANVAQYAEADAAVEISVTTEDGFAVVRIIDGSGILPTDDRDQIEQTLSTPSHETGDGTIGLRLALSRSLIELHNGTILAEVPESSGLAITCRLPLLQ